MASRLLGLDLMKISSRDQTKAKTSLRLRVQSPTGYVNKVPNEEITLDYSREPLPQKYLDMEDAAYLQKDPRMKSQHLCQSCRISRLVTANVEENPRPTPLGL